MHKYLGANPKIVQSLRWCMSKFDCWSDGTYICSLYNSCTVYTCQYIKQQNAVSKIQSNTNHKTPIMLSANFYIGV